jgi:diacylglycerol O-acyltransferase
MSAVAIPVHTRNDEPLSRADLAWLHAEEPTNHFVVTSLALFDRPIDPDRFRAMLSQRIAQHPRLRQIVAPQLNPLAVPRWTPPAEFDLDAHIVHAESVNLGDGKGLAGYIGNLVGRPLDFSRPLWESHIIDGPGGGGALVTRFHPSLGDGQAMVKLLLSLADDTAAGWRRAPQPVRPHRKRPRPVDATRSSFRMPDLSRLTRQGIVAAGTLARLTLLDPDPMTPLRGGLTLFKRVAWSEPLPLAAVKRTARSMGTTVNDVMVSLIAGSLGSYLRNKGEDTHGMRIRAMVPVSMRSEDDTGTSGNRFSLVFLELPVGVTDARERLMRVKIEMDRIKASMEPAVGWLLVQGLGMLPASLEHMTSAFYASKASLVLTNVIGPARRVYLAGSPIRQMTFWEPESGGLGLGVSIYSYAGEITVGAVSDRNLVADPEQITAGVVCEFARLTEAGSPR